MQNVGRWPYVLRGGGVGLIARSGGPPPMGEPPSGPSVALVHQDFKVGHRHGPDHLVPAPGLVSALGGLDPPVLAPHLEVGQVGGRGAAHGWYPSMGSGKCSSRRARAASRCFPMAASRRSAPSTASIWPSMKA